MIYNVVRGVIVMSDENGLKNELRKQIYQFIIEYPGLHKRELSRKLKIPKTTLTHHLRHLEKHGYIIVNSEDRFTRFYAVNHIGNLERKIINMLREKTSRNIILYIGWAYCASQVELSDELDISPNTIQVHLKRLIDAGIVEPTNVKDGVAHTVHIKPKIIECGPPVGREKFYRLTKVPNGNTYVGFLIGELFSSYKKGLVTDEETMLILDLFKFMVPLNKTKKRIKKVKNFGNPIEEVVYSIFPHPYHA